MVTWVRILPQIFILPFKQSFQHCVYAMVWLYTYKWYYLMWSPDQRGTSIVTFCQHKTGGKKPFLSFFKAKRSSLVLFGSYHQPIKLPNQCPTKKLRRVFSWVLMHVEPGSIKNYLPRRDRLLLQAIEIYGSVFQALCLDIGYLFGISLSK